MEGKEEYRNLDNSLDIPTERLINCIFVSYINMIEEEKGILKANIKQLLASAETIYLTGDFISATILYFKAFFAALDLIILLKYKKLPKDHSERFRILEKDYSSFYLLLDRMYPIYQDTYRKEIDKEKCKGVKENVERFIKEQKIFENY